MVLSTVVGRRALRQHTEITQNDSQISPGVGRGAEEETCVREYSCTVTQFILYHVVFWSQGRHVQAVLLYFNKIVISSDTPWHIILVCFREGRVS